MTIKFTKPRQPYDEGDMVDVADSTAEYYINEGSAVLTDNEE